MIESQRIENEKAAKAAVAKFDEVARRAPISAQSRMIDVAVASAPGSDARSSAASRISASPVVGMVAPPLTNAAPANDNPTAIHSTGNGILRSSA